METISDQTCSAVFARKKRVWVAIALPCAAMLLYSIFQSARGEGDGSVQLLGLAMLAAFLAATAILCRCPRCHKFVFDKQSLTPGWTLRGCPHCQAPLRPR